MKLGPQHGVWASQTKIFESDYVAEVGNQINVVLTIGDDQLVIGRDGGVSKQSGRKRFEHHLPGHRLQNAASPKLVDRRKAGDHRDRRMSERHMKHGLGERCVHLGAKLLRENLPGSCIVSIQLSYPSILWTKAIQVQAGLPEMDEVAISAGQNTSCQCR